MPGADGSGRPLTRRELRALERAAAEQSGGQVDPALSTTGQFEVPPEVAAPPGTRPTGITTGLPFESVRSAAPASQTTPRPGTGEDYSPAPTAASVFPKVSTGAPTAAEAPSGAGESGRSPFAPVRAPSTPEAPKTPSAPSDGAEDSLALLTQAPADNKKRGRHPIRTFFVLLLVVGMVAGIGYFASRAVMAMNLFGSEEDAGVEDYPGPGGESVTITVAPGASGNDIAQSLVDAGVTANLTRTLRALNENPDALSIQPGTYALRKQMRSADAVAALLDPAARADTKLTIPEGWGKKAIVDKLAEIGGFPREEVEAALTDPALGLPPEAKGNAEGWLAPATYTIEPGAKPLDVLKQMVELQIQRLDALQVPADKRQEVLIKASILQKEGKYEKDYLRVARVIENRLTQPDGETQGRLDMDSVVCYGLGKVICELDKPEIADPSNAYNVYQHKGLPPGPIANAGEPALRAVLNPEPGPWLYFVTIDLESAETRFASTLAEHDENVKLLGEWCESHRDVCNEAD